jgi:hypothetical protein
VIYQAGPFLFPLRNFKCCFSTHLVGGAQSGFLLRVFSLVRTRWILGKLKDVVDA